MTDLLTYINHLIQKGYPILTHIPWRFPEIGIPMDTPKSSVLKGFHCKPSILGSPPFVEIPIYRQTIRNTGAIGLEAEHIPPITWLSHVKQDGKIQDLPSGKPTVCELENHHATNGKINYFYGHVQ